MKATNLGKPEGLPTMDEHVETQLADLLTPDDPRLRPEPLDVLAHEPEPRRKSTRDQRRARCGGRARAGCRRANTPKSKRGRSWNGTRAHGDAVRDEGLRRDDLGDHPPRGEAGRWWRAAALWAQGGDASAEPDDSETGITAPFGRALGPPP